MTNPQNPTSQPTPRPVSSVMEAAFLAHRPVLLAFLRRRNAGPAAEDVLQDMWVRLPREGAQVDVPLNYLYRMANTLLIDLARKHAERMRRDTTWSDANEPALVGRPDHVPADRALMARQTARRVLEMLDAQGERVARVFRRHRIDGLTQREVAAELGVSIGTVEGDLRRAYRALQHFRELHDEA